MDLNLLNSILPTIIVLLGLLYITGQIRLQTIIKWLLWMFVFGILFLPLAEYMQTNYGNMGYFIVILIFVIAFLVRFDFSRGILQRVTGTIISNYLSTFLIITGVTALVVVVMIRFSSWLGY